MPTKPEQPRPADSSTGDRAPSWIDDDPYTIYVDPTQRRLVFAEIEHLQYHTLRLRSLMSDMDLPPDYAVAVGEILKSLDALDYSFGIDA